MSMNETNGMSLQEKLNYGEMKLDETIRNGGSELDKEYWRGFIAGCRHAILKEVGKYEKD